MELARISKQGQITIPIAIRKKLNLRTGDKVVIIEEGGRFYIENSAKMAFQHAEEDFSGEAEKAGFSSEETLQEYMREIKKEIRG